MAANSSIRLMIVEDHPVFLEGLRLILSSQPDMEVVAQATTSSEAVSAYRRCRPDVTLMDERLPGSTGTDALVTIRGEFPDARVIMLTTSEGDMKIQQALRAGAAAYVLKNTSEKELMKIIRTVHGGQRHIPTDVAKRLAEHLGEDNLTQREMDGLKLIQNGNRNKQIADQLAIAETTVNFHIKNVIDKLRAKDRTHAVTIAIRRGLLQL